MQYFLGCISRIIVIRKKKGNQFKFCLVCCIYFCTNSLGKDMNPFLPHWYQCWLNMLAFEENTLWRRKVCMSNIGEEIRKLFLLSLSKKACQFAEKQKQNLNPFQSMPLWTLDTYLSISSASQDNIQIPVSGLSSTTSLILVSSCLSMMIRTP